jgi:lysozyme family protein
MTEPKSSLPVVSPSAGASGRTYVPFVETHTTNRHGLRDLLLGLGVLAVILGVLTILGRVAEPLNFVLATVLLAVVGLTWLVVRRTGR